MNETVEMESQEGQETGKVVGIPGDYQKNNEGVEDKTNQTETPKQVEDATVETKTDQEIKLKKGQWLLKEGVLGSGDIPPFLLEKYGYNMENQAKAYGDAEKKLGEQSQRLGAFTGAPDKYDFSTIEDDNFAFDTQDKTFNQFVTECQNANVSQDFAIKIAGLAKSIISEPKTNMENEAKAYGASFEEDKKNIENWTKNNNSKEDAGALLDSVHSAAGMRALRNLMNTNGFSVPTNEVHAPPKETLKDVKNDFAANIYEGENLAEHPEKAQKYIDKINRFHK